MPGDIERLEAAAARRLDPAAAVPELEPLLNDLMEFVRRFVVLSPDQLCVVALWIVHTHAIDAAEATPFLDVTSPEKGSGKTRLLEVLELLVHNPWRAVAPSEAVLFRKLDRDRPTLLFDEIDALFGPRAKEHEGVRALLNSGNRRGAVVSRCVGKQYDLKDFQVFGPRALAGIGRLPDTIADRSIPLRMMRRTRDERIEGFGGRQRRRAEADASVLREGIAQWAVAHLPALTETVPDLPSTLGDRAQDGAEPLLAIAEAAGGEWPARSRAAVVSLYGGKVPEEESTGIRLLADIRTVFDGEATDRLTSEALCQSLATIETAPWGAWYGKAITARHLAELLRRFAVRPKKVRTDEDTRQGYDREQFNDAWARYLPPSGSSSEGLVSGTSGTTLLNQRVIPVFDPEHGGGVPDRNSGVSPGKDTHVPDVPDQPLSGKEQDEREGDQDPGRFVPSYIARGHDPGSTPLYTLDSYTARDSAAKTHPVPGATDDGTGWPREIPGLGPRRVEAFGRCETCDEVPSTCYGSRRLCRPHARAALRDARSKALRGDCDPPSTTEPTR